MNHTFNHKQIFGGALAVLGLICGFQKLTEAESFSNKLSLTGEGLPTITLSK
ncbi:MAG: hypothetical protein H7Z18_08400 [Methylophilaceae bacterium]|nr:hypothetical protein [Methylophilaceae bacterium]